MRDPRPKPDDSLMIFTDRARLVVSLAKQFATDYWSREIAPEHILRGLACVGGRSGEILDGLGFDLVRLVPQVLELFPPEALRPHPLPKELRSRPPRIELGSVAKECLQAANRAAMEFNVHYVADDHLLLGLLSYKSPASDFLQSRGVTFELVKDAVVHYQLRDASG